MSRNSGRKPASEARDNRQEIWKELSRDLSICWTLTKLSDAVKVNRKTVADYLVCLEAAGFLETVPGGDSAPPAFRLLYWNGVLAPRLRKDGTPVTQGSGVDNMWRTMRMMMTFSSRDIEVHASTDEVEVKPATAASYCSFLHRTGYLRVVRKATPSVEKAIYRLVRNSGPKAPMIQRIKQVYDPNTGEVFQPGGSS